MKRVSQHIREHLLRTLGMVESKQQPPLENLKQSEWSPRFERLMRNRLIIGAMRYGLLHAKGKPKYNRIASMLKRLNLYKETGNDELLVDVANLCLMEFEEGCHPNKHFSAIDECEEKGHVETYSN